MSYLQNVRNYFDQTPPEFEISEVLMSSSQSAEARVNRIIAKAQRQFFQQNRMLGKLFNQEETKSINKQIKQKVLDYYSEIKNRDNQDIVKVQQVDKKDQQNNKGEGVKTLAERNSEMKVLAYKQSLELFKNQMEKTKGYFQSERISYNQNIVANGNIMLDYLQELQLNVKKFLKPQECQLVHKQIPKSFIQFIDDAKSKLENDTIKKLNDERFKKLQQAYQAIDKSVYFAKKFEIHGQKIGIIYGCSQSQEAQKKMAEQIQKLNKDFKQLTQILQNCWKYQNNISKAEVGLEVNVPKDEDCDIFNQDHQNPAKQTNQKDELQIVNQSALKRGKELISNCQNRIYSIQNISFHALEGDNNQLQQMENGVQFMKTCFDDKGREQVLISQAMNKYPFLKQIINKFINVQDNDIQKKQEQAVKNLLKSSSFSPSSKIQDQFSQMQSQFDRSEG